MTWSTAPDDPNSRNEKGETALTRSADVASALQLIHLGARVRFEEPEDGDTSLHNACYDGKLDLVKLLVEEGSGESEINRFNYLGMSPLGIAAQQGDTELIGYPIKNGADIDGVDEGCIGYTPLQWALEKRQLSAARLLLDLGANPSFSIGLHASPLEIAREIGPQAMSLCREWTD